MGQQKQHGASIFKMQGKYRAAMTLPVYIHNSQHVYFNEGEKGHALERAQSRITMLEAYF